MITSPASRRFGPIGSKVGAPRLDGSLTPLTPPLSFRSALATKSRRQSSAKREGLRSGNSPRQTADLPNGPTGRAVFERNKQFTTQVVPGAQPLFVFGKMRRLFVAFFRK